MNKITIITVCFNAVSSLEETIQSILQQSYKDYEFIIVDGASTDGTLKIIDRYKKHIDTLISEKDSGIYNAMNKGLKQAKGEYIFLLNAGDRFFAENTLEKMFHSDPTADIIYGDVIMEKSDDVFVRKFHPSKMNVLYGFNQTICHQAIFIKNSLYKSLGSFNEHYKISGDYEFFLRVMVSKKFSFQYIPEIVSIYDLSGVSTRNRDIAGKERKESAKSHYGYFTRVRYAVLFQLGRFLSRYFPVLKQYVGYRKTFTRDLLI